MMQYSPSKPLGSRRVNTVSCHNVMHSGDLEQISAQSKHFRHSQSLPFAFLKHKSVLILSFNNKNKEIGPKRKKKKISVSGDSPMTHYCAYSNPYTCSEGSISRFLPLSYTHTHIHLHTQAMASSVPGPIALPESRYDLSTYMGRVRHCAEISDPTMLFTTSSQVDQAKSLISEYKTGKIKQMTDELWRAKKVLDSTVHPDTGEAVLLPFRMSSCVLSNLVVTGGMLTPNLGTAGTLFWQVANQSLNVAINISNANKSHPLSTTQLIVNYSIAVTASCGVALGLNSIVPRLKNISANSRLILGRLVPFAAVVSAGIVNVFAMRSQEIKKGITVFDKNGDPVGTSKTAAVYAVGETAASRVINATPIMVFPPLLLVRLQKTVLKGKGLGIQTLANIGIIAATSFAVLPFALAVFPQYQAISVHSLERELAGKKDKDGNPIETVYFNRGI